MATKIKKIGHASISESGTVNGAAGDSTGKEVCIVSNYNISRIQPYIVLRPTTDTLAEVSARACIAGCSNNNIGYSQNSRNTLYSRAKELNSDLTQVDLSKIETKCNTDCSAFMSVCAIVGGANITYGSNGPTTSTMRTRFKQSGDYIVLTGTEYTNSADLLTRGDILVHEGHHTIMVLENGDEIPEIPIEPDVEDDEPTEPIDQVVTPITDGSWVDQQFNSGLESIKKVYIKVNNEYKQAAVYLSNNPVILHLNKEIS